MVSVDRRLFWTSGGIIYLPCADTHIICGALRLKVHQSRGIGLSETIDSLIGNA
jgi:hypothetical protein